MKKQLLAFALALFVLPSIAFAGKVIDTNSLVGAQGYDLVSYHGGKPQQGNGNHVAVHNNVSYIFTSKANKKAFQKNPNKYLPAYGGYCAYGVSVGKKFVGDPEVWKIVDGKLYLNLDTKVQEIWNQDISGNISKANSQWKGIKGKSPSDL